MRMCASCGLRDPETTRTACLVCRGELVEAKDPRIGDALAGRYVLEEVIGVGGMATVYRARHTVMSRPYSVKVLNRELADDEALVERMRREGRTTASLSHPNIVEIYDFGMTDDGAPYLVMELLTGKPLRALISEGAMDLQAVLEIGGQMTLGLARAHDFGVVHRDLKPENVFIENHHGEAVVKLTDLGIARSAADSRLTGKGMLIGTPQYMAPERTKSEEVTPSCDLYSLGIVLFEMATGTLPFQSNSATGFIVKHVHEAPPRPSERADVDPGLEKLILELLAKDPAERPVDAHQVIGRLRALDTSTPSAPEPTSPRPARPRMDSIDTAPLDAWQTRVGMLETMLRQMHDGEPPTEPIETLAEIRAMIDRSRALRDEGVAAQRDLDSLQAERGVTSERLGHAAHVLAKDLSRAREEGRTASQEAQTRTAEVAEAEATFHDARQRVAKLTAEAIEAPDDELVACCRAMADGAERWQRSLDALGRSKTRAERSAAEVSDLDYQVEEIRQTLERLEASIAERGARSREVLERTSEERAQLEQRVAAMTHTIVEPMRERTELKLGLATYDALARR